MHLQTVNTQYGTLLMHQGLTKRCAQRIAQSPQNPQQFVKFHSYMRLYNERIRLFRHI